MIDGQNVSNQPVKNKLITYDTGQGNDYTTGYLLLSLLQKLFYNDSSRFK